MNYRVRLLHLLLLVTLAGSLLAPVSGVISAQEPATPEPSEEVQTAEAGVGSLLLVASEVGNPVNDVCFSINGDTQLALCTGSQGTMGESLVEGLALGSYTVEALPPSDYIASGSQTVEVTEGGMSTATFTLIAVMPTPTPTVVLEEPEPDTTAPNVVFASPLEGDTLSGTATVSAYADDPSGVAAVRFKYSTTPTVSESWVTIAEDSDGSDGWSAELDTTAIPNGPVTVRVYAEDVPGNQITTNISVIIDNPVPDTTPPTAHFISPQPGATLAGTVTVSAFADDPSGVAFVRFEYSTTPSDLGSWVLIANDTDGTDGWSGELDTTAIPDGPVTVRLYADDFPGSSRSTVINVFIDNADPNVAFDIIQDGDTLTGTVTLAANADDPSGVRAVRFKYSATPDVSESWVTIAEDTDGSDGWWTDLDTTLLPNGPVSLRAVAEDMLGNTSTAEISVTINNPVAAPQIEVTVTASNEVIAAGEMVSFIFTVSNAGDGAASDVVLTDVLPFGLTWVVASPVDGCSIDGYVLSCQLGDLAPEQAVSVTVTAATSPGDCGVISLGTASIAITCPDVAVVVEAVSTSVNAGDAVSFTISVANVGLGTAYGVNLIDELPVGLAWTEDSAACTISSAVLICDYGNLPEGGAATVTVTAGTTSQHCGVITNTAMVAVGNESPAATSNNMATAAVTVTCPTGIQVTLLDENNNPLPDGCFELWETVDGVQFGNYVGTVCDDYDLVSDGVTRFTDVPAGSYIVRQGLAPSMYPRLGQQVITVMPGESAELVFHAILGGRVTIRFFEGTDPALNFSAGVYVDDGTGQLSFVMNGQDGWGQEIADGALTIDNLPPGDLVILSGHTGVYLNPDPVLFTITPGEDKVVDIQVQRGGTLRFSTTDANGIALLGSCFYLRVNDASGETVNHLCDGHDGDNGTEDGTTTFFKLTTGTYYWEQTVAAPNYIAGQTGTIEVLLGEETTIPVQNTLAGSIVVTLLDEQSEPLPHGYFRLERDLGDGTRETVAYACDSCDGSYDGVTTFNGIPAGDYIIVQWVAIDGYLPAPDEPVTVTTGQLTSKEMIAAVAPPPSEPPVANQDNVTTNVGEPVTIYPLANDTDADTPHEELALTLLPADGPSHGTVELDPGDPTALIYTPNPGFFGTDGFYYEVSDGSNSATGWVRVSVIGTLELHVASLDPVGAPIRSACFDLYTVTPEDTRHQNIATACDSSDPAGVTIFTGLAEGRYLLANISWPNGYDMPPDQLVDVGPDPVTTVSITYPLVAGEGAVRIHALAGATFLPGLCWEVAHESEPGNVSVECDSYDGVNDGITTVYYQRPGNVTIRALSAPGGYLKAEPQDAVVVDSEITVAPVQHIAGPHLRVVTLREDGSAVLGACVSVFTNAGSEFVDAKCDSNGTLDGETVLPVLPPGAYVAMVNGGGTGNDYLPVSDYHFTVLPDGTVDAGPGGETLTVVYTLAGGATISFTDTNGDPLTRTVCYRIYHDAGAGVRGIPLTIFDSCLGVSWPPDGETPVIEPLTLSGMAPGNYLFTLVAPTHGLALASDAPFTIVAGENLPYTIIVEEQAPDATASLVITTVNAQYQPIATAQPGQTVQITYLFSNSGAIDLTSSRLIGHGGAEVEYWDVMGVGYMEIAFQPYLVTEADAARGSITFTGTVTSDQGHPISASWTIQIVAEPNTPVDPDEPVVAAGGTGATLTFSGIEEAGFTAVTPLPEPPQEPVPGAFSIEGALFFEISTTATFTGQVLVCIPYEEGTIPNARLLHFDDGAWVDITSAADSSDGRVCGLTDHFSPFAIVQLLDSEGPEITTPGPITVEATSAAGATVTFEEPTAVDTGSGLATLSCSHASGDTFTLGTTMVTCTATDNAGNTSSETFTILVEDTTAPTVTPIDPITAEATGPAGASVTFTVPTAIDLVSETVTVACAPASGTTFLIGTTTVTCTAEDAAGNVGTADFTITVEDTTAPVFAGVAPITVEATGPDGATVEWAGVTVNDAVDPAPSVTCAVGEETVQSGDTFALGSHEVSCTVTDTSDNSASASFTITVQDTTPPVITVPEAIVVEATSPAGAVVTYANPTAMDVVSGSVSVTCDADTGDTFAIGTTTVTCTAEDTAGNEATATFTVTVNTTLTPTNKNQCKNGGWQRFNNPFFVDQGSCVSFAEKKKK